MSSSSASTSAASSILERIFAAKRAELEVERAAVPLEAIREAARRAPAPRDLLAALRAHRPAIIAEIKRASPSRGDILPGLDPAAVAREYAASGAAAISVLTDRHFKGSLEDLRTVRAAVNLPLLRKDFIFDPYQLHQARAAGADGILLIAAMLNEADLRALYAAAREIGLQALVEVHNEDELRAAGRAGAEIVGINNRDLHTFVTDIAVTERLLKDYRGAALVVSESGIDTPEDIRRLDRAGARAFLIGESLLRGGVPRLRLETLCSALVRSEG
ncbi:MAG TPA: indole-3-glycerol phosphate synthase TrpC [Candidatus Binataceae bacterium]|nr:indole-3-glycerol phosphate synthase TrpC [Candidatus Binataceae bacterium]